MTKSISSFRIALPLIFIWLIAGFSAKATNKDSDIPQKFRPGFIITHKNDTIDGLVEYTSAKNAHLRCRFIKSPGDEIQTFGPRELNGYGFGQKQVFKTKAIDMETFLRHVDFDISQLQESDEIIHLLQHFDFVFSNPETGVEPVLQNAAGEPVTMQPLFLEVLLQGEISMYSYNHLYFAQKENGELFLLQQRERKEFIDGKEYIYIINEYQGVLKFLTQSCPKVSAGVRNIRFSLNDIRGLIASYNDCRGIQFWLPPKKLPILKINPGISLINGYSTLSFKTNPDLYSAPEHVEETVTTVYPGLYVDIMFPRTSNRINLALGAEFYNVEFSDYSFVQQTATLAITDQAFLKQSHLKIPLELHYRPWKSSLHPSILAGINLNFTVKDDQLYETTVKDKETGEMIAVYSRIFNTRKTFNPGLVIGADMRKSLGNHFYLAAGIRYEIASSIFSIEKYTQSSVILPSESRLQTFSFQLSLLMNLTDFYK